MSEPSHPDSSAAAGSPEPRVKPKAKKATSDATPKATSKAEPRAKPEATSDATPKATSKATVGAKQPEATSDATPDADRPADRRRALRRKIAAVAVVVGLCLGVVVTRAVWEGSDALAAGDAALDRGDPDEAIRRWRRAARWYVPGAPHVGRAYDRMEHLARQAEERGDDRIALAAWRGVRGSILATRSFYVPHEHRLDPANRRIAALMARAEGAAADPGKTEAERADWHYALLERDPSPSVPWSLIAVLGLALWLGGGFLFALRGVTASDQLVPRTAAYAGLLVAVGLVVWMLGLYLA